MMIINNIVLIYLLALMFLYRHLWKKSCKQLRETEEDRDYWKTAAGYEEIKETR